MKKNTPEIFRAYDIRGVYPEEINGQTAYLIGQAFVEFLGKKNPKIVIGRDNRLSSPELSFNLIKGILSQGGDVVDIGLATTPLFYFAAAHFKFDGGVQVTASHNPSQYNGFKIVRERATPISEKSGLKEIKNLFFQRKFKKKTIGKIRKMEVLKEYLRFNLKDFNLSEFKPLKIVIDTANGVAGIIIPEIFKKTACKIYHLFSSLDGSFPNHPPDPLIAKNLKWLREKVREKKADLGVAFDGDGDRIIFVDEKAKIISGDLITALIAETILTERPKAKILYDLCSSNIVRETIKRMGGKAIMSRVGHSFIKEKMRREKIIFGGELSGHYCHRDHYFSECPFFVLLKIIEKISETKTPLSQLILPFQKYYHSTQINFRVENQDMVLKKLERIFKKGKMLRIDGLRIDFPEWWFNIRPSNTEPIVRLVIEAKTKKLLKEKKKELINFLTNFQ